MRSEAWVWFVRGPGFALAVASGLAFLVIPAAINQFNELGTRLLPLLDNVRAWAEGSRPPAQGDSIPPSPSGVAR